MRHYLFSIFLLLMLARADAEVARTCIPLADELYALFQPGETIADIQKIGGGFANHLWLIEATSGKYVLRIPYEKEPVELFKRSLDISENAFALGVAPRVVGVDVDRQWTLIEYVAAAPWPVYHENMRPYVDAMKALKVFHTHIEATSAKTEIPFSTIFEKGERLFSNSLLPCHFFMARQRYLRIYECLQEWLKLNSTLCHGDFHKGNVLLKLDTDEAHPLLIDFDTAARGHPFFDVAKFTATLDPAARLKLLKAYLDREPTESDQAHFELMDLSLLLVVAVVRYNYVLEMNATSEVCLSKEEMEALLDGPDALPPFTSISFGEQSVKMRQLGALCALGEFLFRTQGKAFERALQLVSSSY